MGWSSSSHALTHTHHVSAIQGNPHGWRQAPGSSLALNNSKNQVSVAAAGLYSSCGNVERFMISEIKGQESPSFAPESLLFSAVFKKYYEGLLSCLIRINSLIKPHNTMMRGISLNKQIL